VPSGLALVLRGLWWRRGTSAALLLACAVAVAGAAAGPLWGRAAQDSLLARTLDDAPVSAAGLVLGDGVPSLRASPPGERPPAPSEVEASLRARATLPSGLDELLDEPTTAIATERRLQVVPAVRPGQEGDDLVGGSSSTRPLGALLWRENACEQVELVAGVCPQGSTELLLSDRSADELGVEAGEQVLLPELADEPPVAGSEEPFPVTFTVSGVYSVASVVTTSRFWFDGAVTEYAPSRTFDRETLPARLDSVLVTRELLEVLRVPGTTVRVERSVLPGAVRLDDVDRVRSDLADEVSRLEGTAEGGSVQAPLVGVLHGTVAGRELVGRSAQLVGLQVVLVGWFVLFGLVGGLVASRGGELGLARLRGVRGARLLRYVLAEPFAVLLLAVPVGLGLAAVVAAAAAGTVLHPGTWGRVLAGDPVAVWAPVAVAVGATVAGGALAGAVAARRALRARVGDQLRRSAAGAVAGPVATAVLVTVLVVGVVLVRTPDGGAAAASPPALLVPVGAALVAGLLAAAVVRHGTALARRRTGSLALPTFLAVRRVAVDGGLTRATALVTAVTVVTGFAAAAWSIADQQRDAQAGVDVGAERVVLVEPVDVPDLLAATEVADPDGRWAMAATERRVDEQPGASLLAVDSRRLDAVVARLPRGVALPPGTGAGLVPDDVVAPLHVRGSLVSLVAGVVSDARSFTLHLHLRGTTAAGEPLTIDLGEPPPEPVPMTAPTNACAEGCTISQLALVPRGGVGSVSGVLTLGAMSVDGTEVDGLDARDWRPARVDERLLDSPATGTVEQGTDALTVEFSAPQSAGPGVVRRDVPPALPAVLVTGTELPAVGVRQYVAGTGLDGGVVNLQVLGEQSTVPRIASGALVDLDLASRLEPPRTERVRWQVWLGPAAPLDGVARLEDAGLVVVEVTSRAERRAELDAGEPARALLLLLGAGAAVLLVGGCAVATALASSVRRRRAEGAALQAMAVPARTVRRVARTEDAMVLLPGLVVGGVVAGLVATTSGPVLAAVTGASDAVAGQTTAGALWWPVVVVAVGTGVLLAGVALAVAGAPRRRDLEDAMRSGT
jgi:hypothetical protein